jgi:hypothetical protein
MLHDRETIHHGHVRLWADGTVEHFDKNTCTWQAGWGPWRGVTILGQDEAAFDRWKGELKAWQQ